MDCEHDLMMDRPCNQNVEYLDMPETRTTFDRLVTNPCSTVWIQYKVLLGLIQNPEWKHQCKKTWLKKKEGYDGPGSLN